MKKILYTMLVALVLGLCGCLALDLDEDTSESGTTASEVQDESLSEQASAQEEAISESDIGTEAYFSCEGKRCGEPCGTGGYVCDPLGQCLKGNPGCD